MKEVVHRNTAQRQIVLDVVNQSHDHPTAERIYERAREKAPHISLGTVYRNLAHLAENGSILKVSTNGADHYDFNLENHFHFLCTECGEMCDIPKEFSPSHSELMSPQRADFDITDYSLVYLGHCPECKNRKGE